jgi:hypothetical protein
MIVTTDIDSSIQKRELYITKLTTLQPKEFLAFENKV